MLSRLLVIVAIVFTVEAIDIEEEFSNPHLRSCLQTVKMFDASGKIPSGILSGNIIELGHFDQCLSIDGENDESKSRYCLMKVVLPSELTEPKLRSLNEVIGKNFLKFPEVTANNSLTAKERIAIEKLDPVDSSLLLMMGWCLPKTCDIYMLSNILTKVVRKIDSDMKVIPVDVEERLLCQTSDDLKNEYNTRNIIFIAFLCATLFLMIISTLYDAYIQHHKKKPAHIILTAFSVKTNGPKLFTVNNNPDQLPCVNGIRVLSMMWVVYGHRASTSVKEPIINYHAIQNDVPGNPAYMYLLNASVAVDSFLILNGLLVGYNYCRAMDKGVKFNIFLFYINRYLRMTPVLAVVVWFHVTILGFFGSGPFWPSIKLTYNKACEENWWSTLLYVQNYVAGQEMCVVQTWYLAVDMQVFILSPIILIPLWKWPKQTMMACAVLVLGSMAIVFGISYAYDLPAFTLNRDTTDYMEKYYYPMYTRYGPWLMGLMLGYYLFAMKRNKNNKPELHPATVVLGWIASIVLLVTIVFAGHDLMLNPHQMSEYIYNTFHRHGWALGVCWVIYACTQGYGGPINTFLSSPLFQFLGRVTYAIFLVHFTFQRMVSGSTRTNTYATDFRIMYVFWGDFMLSLAVAVFLTLAYESPMETIEKVLFKTGEKSTKPVLPVQQNPTTAETAQTKEEYEGNK